MKLSALTAAALFVVALAAPASAEPALWKVQGPHATVYLFGTVHLLKSTTQWRSPKIDAAFAAADALWEEVPNADDLAVMQPLITQLGLDPAHPLSSQLDDAGKAKLTAFEKAYGLPAEQIDALRPWFAALTFSVIPTLKSGYDGKNGPDLILKKEALARGKPVLGFETLEQQLHLFADMPQKLQLDYLTFTLDNSDQTASRLGELVDNWNAGDGEKLQSVLNSDLFRSYPKLYQILLVERNRAFAVKIEELLRGNGTVFVAVGAGHLVGPDSVQADLAKDGFQAVRQ